MPFTVYIDDSGTDPNQAVACATALIIPAARILNLESELKNLKEKEGFTDFHTSEFVARNSDSEFTNWDDAKHQRVFRRMREITKKHIRQVFSFSVQKRVVHWRGAISKDVISGEMVSRIVKKHTAHIGKDAKQYGGHSLRRGFCTGAAKGGATEVQIMQITGHRSSAMVREYVEEAGLFETNTSALLGL